MRGRRASRRSHRAQRRARHRQRDRRRLADFAAALEPVEDAGAEIAPGLVDTIATLQAHRRDVGAGGKSQVDIDQWQRAAEIEVQRTARRGIER